MTDDDELFAIGRADLWDEPIVRAVRDMTPGEVIAAIDYHSIEAGKGVAQREKLARLLAEVAQKHPSLRDPV